MRVCCVASPRSGSVCRSCTIYCLSINMGMCAWVMVASQDVQCREKLKHVMPHTLLLETKGESCTALIFRNVIYSDLRVVGYAGVCCLSVFFQRAIQVIQLCI